MPEPTPEPKYIETKSQQALKEQIASHKEIYEDIPGINIIVDTRGNIQYASEEFYSTFNQERSTIVDLNILDILPDSDERRDFIKHAIRTAKEGESGESKPEIALDINQEKKSFRINPKFIKDKEGKKIGISMNLQDISGEMIDPTTNIANKRFFTQELDRTLMRYVRDFAGGKPTQDFWVAVGDIDRFKTLNDACGYNEGDNVLRDIAGATRINRYNLQSRYGGEEFAFMFLESKDKVIEILNSFLLNIKEIPARKAKIDISNSDRGIFVKEGDFLSVTMSFGVISVENVIRDMGIEKPTADDVAKIRTELIGVGNEIAHKVKKEGGAGFKFD